MTLPAYPVEPLRPTQCRTPVRLQGESVNPVTGEIDGTADVDRRCGRWICEGCGLRLKRLHRKLVELGIDYHGQRGSFARFLTITMPTDVGAMADNPDDVAEFSARVAQLVQEIRRTHNPRLEYYAVKEETKRGRLHAHLITTGPYLRKCRGPKKREGEPYLDACLQPAGCLARLEEWQANAQGRRPRPCVQAIAHRLGLGYVHIRKIHNTRGAAIYVAKYLGKQVGRSWPKHSRRVSYSLGRLVCDTHPENTTGRRCCPEACRRTFFAPTTIRSLDKAKRDIGYAWAIGQGLIEYTPRHLVINWRYDPTPRAPPPPDTRALIERSEAECIHLAVLRIDTGARAVGIDPDNPMHGDALRNFLKTATIAPA